MTKANTCAVTTSCDNVGVNVNTISAADLASVDLTTSQTNSQGNTCDTSVPCLNEGVNQVTVAADATDSVAATLTQTNTESNTCSGAGSGCTNSMANVASIGP